MPLTKHEVQSAIQCLTDITRQLTKMAKLEHELSIFVARNGMEASMVAGNIYGNETTASMERQLAKMERQSEQQRRIGAELEDVAKGAGQMRPQAEHAVINLQEHMHTHVGISDTEKTHIIRAIREYRLSLSIASGGKLSPPGIDAVEHPESVRPPIASTSRPDYHQSLLSEATKNCSEASFLKAIQDRNYSQAMRKLCAAQSLVLLQVMKPFLSSLAIDINQPAPSNGWTALDWLDSSLPVTSENKRIMRAELIGLGARSGRNTTATLSRFETTSPEGFTSAKHKEFNSIAQAFTSMFRAILLMKIADIKLAMIQQAQQRQDFFALQRITQLNGISQMQQVAQVVDQVLTVFVQQFDKSTMDALSACMSQNDELTFLACILDRHQNDLLPLMQSALNQALPSAPAVLRDAKAAECVIAIRNYHAKHPPQPTTTSHYSGPV